MITKQSIQDFFHRDWRGAEALLNEILIPVFGEAERGYSEILDEDDTLREQAARNNIQAIRHYATFYIGDLEMKVFDVTIADNCHIAAARKGIQTIVRLHLNHFEGALMAFHYTNPAGRSWRLSYMEKRESNTASTNPKRYTYLCGSNYSCRTIAERFYALQTKEKNAQTLQTAFSVEALSDEFFDEYKVFYEDIVQYISGTRFVEITKNKYERNDGFLHDKTIFAAFLSKAGNDQAAAEKMVRDYVKKLLGRLVFLQFLQKKGWMGAPASQTDWTGGDRRFMHRLFLYATAEQQADYINRVLNPLFFRCLNEQRNHDVFDTSVHAYGDNGKVRIPYLNGGLFEQDPYSDIAVPLPAYFFSNGVQQDTARTFSKNADKANYPYDHACGLFDFFDRYNFMIDENDPDDAEVGVDPEMLGKIFENLLEDNKDKGAYYTPKEIVRYMCEESLIAYLETECPAAGKADLRSFITTFSVPDTWLVTYNGGRQLNDTAQQVLDALRDVKICDPAIGSGAFPMGLLNILYHCGKALGEFYGNAPQQHDANAKIKRHIIQNNIYGVDIEKGAVDIARLRFWLALIVDEQTPEALPNLDYKIMQGNSLLTTFNGEYLNLSDKQTHTSAKTLRELKAILYRKQKDFYNKTGNDKYEAEIEIKQLLLDIIEVQLGYERESWSGKHLQTGDLFAPVQPIIKPQIPFEKQKIIDLCTTLREQLNNKTQPLSSRAATVIPFFDWQIMFSDVFNRSAKQGFDIVIGNPPYIEAKKLKSIAYVLKPIFEVYSGTADLSIYFQELGLNICGERGVTSFITTNKFFNTGYGKPVRKLLTDNTISQIINFEQCEVFEDILVSSVIISVIKQPTPKQNVFRYHKYYKLDFEEFKKLFSSQKEYGSYAQKNLSDAEWSFADTSEMAIKAHIEYGHQRIGEIDSIHVFRGVTTGYNPAFIISNEKKNELIKSDIRNAQVIKNMLQGRNIRKWYYEESEDNLIFTRRGIDIKEYPYIEKYLSQFYEQLKPKKQSTDLEGRKPGTYKWFEILDNTAYYTHFEKKEKIIWGLTADKWAYTLDTEQHYLPSNGYILTSDSIPTRYILGLLNSNLLHYYFHFIGVMTAGGAYTLKAATIEALPLVIADEEQQNKIIDLVDEILAAKKANPQADTTQEEQQIDKLVYQLYGLTEQEIQIIEGK